MTERPPGSGAPEEGTPEFDWLYGSGSSRQGRHRSGDDATRPVPRQPRPEETRVLPATAPAPDPARLFDDETDDGAGEPTEVMGTTDQTGTPHDMDAPDTTAAAASGAAGSGGTERGWGRRGRSRPPSNARRNEGVRPEAVRGPTRPTPPPVAPPPSQGRSRPRFRFRFRYVWLLLLVWLIFLVVVPLIAWNRVGKIDAMPNGDRPGDQSGTTYLLVGSDSRADLSAAERKALNTGNAGGGRTDTIMLLHTGAGPNLLMSIPRDSLVPIPGHGTTKINAAYAYGGPKLLVRTIEQNTGIRIDDYVEIGFGGFVELVDAVGGIQICPKEDMVDADANLKIKKGCQDVEGDVALAYARSRHAQQLGDLDRAAHQREVVSAVGNKAVSLWSVLNPLRYWRLNMAGAGAVAIGDGTSPISAAKFAVAMTRVDGDTGLTCGVPISDLAVHWDTERAKQMFQHIKDDDTKGIGKNLCTPSGLAR